MRGLAQPVEIAGVSDLQPLQETASEHAEGLSADVPFCLHLAQVPKGGAPANKVIGIVCSGDVAVHRDQVKTTIEKGLQQRPDAVWVCIEPKSDRLTHDVMLSLDIEPVVLPMIVAWKCKHEEHGYDLRRVWRDSELLHLCDELIVFHKRTGSSPWRDRHATGIHRNLYVIELGDPPKVKRSTRTRKPAHA